MKVTIEINETEFAVFCECIRNKQSILSAAEAYAEKIFEQKKKACSDKQTS